MKYVIKYLVDQVQYTLADVSAIAKAETETDRETETET